MNSSWVGDNRKSCEKAYIFLANCAFFAVVRVANAWTSAYHASSLIGAVIALITDTNQRAWPHVGIANNTFSVTLLAQPTNSCNPHEQTKHLALRKQVIFFQR